MNLRPLLLTLVFVLSFFAITKAQFFYESSIGKPLQAGQLRAPSDVAIDGSGNIFVADAAGQIVKFNVGGTQLLSFGTRGPGNGQFNYPNCIALDQSGNIYVADSYNSTVLKFNSSGNFQSNLATFGSGNGQVNGPEGIDIDGNGNIFVSDRYNNRVLKFNSAGVFQKSWGTQGTGNGQFSYANAVAIDAGGNVYILDTSNQRVQKFNNNGDYSSQWGSTGGGDGQFGGWPLGMTTDASGNVYVSEYFSHRLQKFNINGGFTSKFGSFGSNNNEFYFPKGMAIDAAGNIYVADESNSRVQKFNSSFSYQSTIGIPLGDEQLYNPYGLAIDAAGNIYVADTFNDQIQKFSSTGTFITRWGGFGFTNGKFNSANDVAIDAVGNVYVVDGGCSVQKFSSNGTFLQKWAGTYGSGDNQLADPRGIAIDASNNVYVVDKNNHRIVKYSSSGTFITKWGQLGIGTGDFNNPNGIAIDASGNIYVCDTENDRILKFTNSGVPLSQWSTTSTGNALFDNPFAICISPSGKIFITDSNRIQIFDSNGQYLGKYDSYSFGGGGFLGPLGIETNAAGDLYLADRGNHRINKYSVLDILALPTNNGVVGASITISGTGFSTIALENVVKFNGITATVTSASATSLTVTVPTGATTGKVSVTRGGFTVQSTDEFLVLPLAVTSFSPAVSAAGGTITITGTGFSSVPANNIVKFNGVQASVTASTATSLVATLPTGNTLGKITVTVNGVTATSANDFSGALSFSAFSPTSGLAGSSVTITGSGFGNATSSQQVFFNGTAATVTASSLNSVTVTVPAGATTGKISITREGTTVTSAAEFVALPLAISSFSPAIGLAVSSVVITGTGFSSVPANNAVSFNGVPAVVTASSATSASVTVPASATTGKITITTGGVSATSSADFKVTKLAITGTSFPDYYVLDNTNVTVTIGLNDITHFQSLKINSKGITQEDNSISSDVITFTSASNSLQVNIPASYFSDPLGLSYWFTAMDKDGNEINSAKGYTYLKYPSSSDKQIIPGLINGKSAAAYQLIAIPLELTNKTTANVFKALGSYDDKKWRLFNLSSAQEITERPQTINAGSGYWFISKDLVEINPGEGAVPKANQDAPFKINLVKGWNLIGNPYNFSISWNDVLARNNLTEQQIKLRQFINGAFVGEPLLKTYRGAFVESDIARTIEIPVINKSASGGRSTSSDSPTVGDAQWQINLAVNDGAITNALYGLGMHPLASAEKDLWDEALLPMVEGLASYDLSFKTTQSLLMKSVVPTANDNSWVADLAAGQEVTITWDNSFPTKDDKKLVLDISDRVELVDMQKTNQVKIPAGKHTLRFHFGSAAYIEKQVLDNAARIGNVFPNPVSISESSLHIPISLPEGDNEVMLELTDITGKSLGLLAAFKLPGGRQVLLWNADFKTLRDGMFLLKVSTFNPDQKTKSVYQKIVVK